MNPSESFTVTPGMGILISDLGVSPGNVLRRAGLPGDLFSRGTVSVSTEQYFALWRAVEVEAGDVEVPLRFAEVISLEVFDVPIFAAACSPNLRVAAERIAEYKRLIGPIRLSVITTTRGLELENSSSGSRWQDSPRESRSFL